VRTRAARSTAPLTHGAAIAAQCGVRVHVRLLPLPRCARRLRAQRSSLRAHAASRRAPRRDVARFGARFRRVSRVHSCGLALRGADVASGAGVQPGKGLDDVGGGLGGGEGAVGGAAAVAVRALQAGASPALLCRPRAAAHPRVRATQAKHDPEVGLRDPTHEELNGASRLLCVFVWRSPRAAR
jgi:hypothetical protein